MYNLNDSSFDSKGSVTIFNDGKAGLVENVSMSVSKKKPEDKENAPDYKVVFTDANGGECSTSYWYVTKATEYASIEDQIKKQGTAMKHIIHAVYGKDFQIPVNATTPQQLLDQSMKLIREGLASGAKFRIFATYGTLNSRKEYIQPRSWVPFVENMTHPGTDTSLKVSANVDAIERLTKDTVVPAKSNESLANSIISDGDEW
jgi:hypothetical protein